MSDSESVGEVPARVSAGGRPFGLAAMARSHHPAVALVRGNVVGAATALANFFVLHGANLLIQWVLARTSTTPALELWVEFMSWGEVLVLIVSWAIYVRFEWRHSLRNSEKALEEGAQDGDS